MAKRNDNTNEKEPTMPYEVLKDETKRKAAWARRARAKIEMIGDSLQLTVHDEDGTTGRPLAFFKASSDLYDALKEAYPPGSASHDKTCPVLRDAPHYCNCKAGRARAALAKAEGREA